MSQLRCPNCKKICKVQTKDSRSYKGYHKRRRLCTDCQQRFTTYEINEEEYTEVRKAGRLLKQMRQIAGAS